ncbi:LysR family transcriptional regulator [Benzoatithermus flavus]|uniref:LysR family transcriptional regulator n=1 Tax=Benzoatithermus flavus TaxID=3108223 RepID=A0ABU8XPP8_9PROT
MSLLENMQVFTRVVELGSLSAAGRHLRLSPAVVSHRLQQLEQHLGVRLLNRTTRQVQPTEQGAAFYEACQEVLAAVAHAESVVADSGGTPKGNLRVTAPLGFGRRILAPLVPVFQARYPQIGVRLRLSDHLLDLLREAVDVAIRLAVLTDSSLIARKIADCPRVLCAAPEYLAAHGVPERPEDLLEHQCLLLRFPGSQQYRWTLRTAEGPVTLPVAGRFDADDGDVLTEWALLGQGIVMKPVFEIAEHLRSGRLLRILPDAPPEPATLAVVYPHRRLLPPKVKVFADFMVEEVGGIIARQSAGLLPPAAAA